MDSRLVLFEVSRMLESADGVILISSSKLGVALGVSQQTASRYLSSLEKKGLIKRVIKKRGQEISLTKEGFSVLSGMYAELGFFVRGERTLEIDGLVSIGLGEGAYYVKIYVDKIEKELGFKPFYGTLNVTVDEIPSSIHRFTFKRILPFEREGRSFGEIKIIKVRLISNKKSTDCFLILPERTHHKNELELVSRENLRKKLGLKNGSPVKLRITV